MAHPPPEPPRNAHSVETHAPAKDGNLELWAVLSYKDGDEHSWETEFAYLRETHSDRLAELRKSILTDGIKSPIVIGPDGRVWDGHHRLCIADELGMTTVPVTFDTSVIPTAGGGA